ncbi:MAG: thiamine pyrophosphate-dependent enzyme [Gemmataceae bacterium]
MDLKVLLFNNEIYGLTKGQYSPASRLGTKTKTSPQGSFETPLRPLTTALASEATFVACTIDIDVKHPTDTLIKAAAHKGNGLRRNLPELQDLQRRRLRLRDRQIDEVG